MAGIFGSLSHRSIDSLLEPRAKLGTNGCVVCDLLNKLSFSLRQKAKTSHLPNGAPSRELLLRPAP